jgi:hypothetical protein
MAFCDYQFSCNIKVIASTVCKAAVLILRMGAIYEVRL